MNKLISILIVSLLIFQNTFAYTPSETDKTILNNVYLKVDKLNPNSFKKLYNQVNILKSKYKNNEKVKYLLSELGKYIYAKIAGDELYEVLEVSDGDTIKINYNGTKTTLRLIGIDAPESYTTGKNYKECYGENASDYLKILLTGKKVSIELDESQGLKDKYDRLLVYIYLNGVNINAQLIQEGYAYEYTYDSAYKYQKEFQDLEIQAKQENKGLWATNTCNGERKAINNNTTNQTNTVTNNKVNTNTIQTNNNNTSDTKYYNPNDKNYLNMGYNCDKTMYCKYMTSCNEVKYYYYKCGGKTFDGDKDDIPCENMCGSVVR